LTYELPYDTFGNTQISLGYGVFTGGDPTVHFANAFQNFGGAIGSGTSAAAPCGPADLQVLTGGNFTGIPACIGAQQIANATQNLGDAAAVDPNFELPSQHRYNFGVTHLTEFGNDFLSDWSIQFDFIYSDAKDAAEFLDLTLTPNGVTLPDGRPQFFAIDPLLPGCNATFNGPGQGFSNAGPDGGPCDAGGDDQDILLTNGVSGSTTSVSLQLSKLFELGSKTSMDLRLGYAYTDSEVGNPVNSSTATSGYEEVATAVINNNQLGPAVYANKHNFVLRALFDHYFFENNPTSIGLFFRRRSGNPFSFTYDNNTPTTLFGDSDNEERNLFYVPTGPTDPLVDFSSLDAAGTTQDFFNFLDATGLSRYAGTISPKNAFNEPWTSDLDVRIAQDIPLPWADHSFKVFLDIENILNLFSDSNNIQRYADIGDIQEGVPVLDAAFNGTQYVYSNFNPGNGNSAPTYNITNQRDVDDSVWRIQLGFRYQF
jgi:hypothetical protein